MKLNCLASLSVLFALSAAGAANGSKALTVGDHAPLISVHAWVKGNPVAQFERGKIYVVDFFATWCPPCNSSMPHLSKIAKEYKGKVVVMGVDVRENERGNKVQPGAEMDAKVRKFAKTKGADMAYNVCTDDLKGSMMANWMTASGEHGIPCVFIIDQSGRVADIILGYGPNDQRLDMALDQVLAGKFDYKAAAAAHRAEIGPKR